MSYDSALADRVAASFESLGYRHVRQKNVFGGRGFMLGKSAAVIVWDDGLIVKTAPNEYADALREPGVSPFAPDGERPMSTWVVVSADVIADDPELAAWVQRGCRALGR
jgi:TfoX/Sxy family transcriptional regulator of competence genes